MSVVLFAMAVMFGWGGVVRAGFPFSLVFGLLGVLVLGCGVTCVREALDSRPALVFDECGISGRIGYFKWIQPVPWGEIESISTFVVKESTDWGKTTEIEVALRDDRYVLDQMRPITRWVMEKMRGLTTHPVLTINPRETDWLEHEIIDTLNDCLLRYREA